MPHIGAAPLLDWQIEAGVGRDPEERGMAAPYNRHRHTNYGQMERWPSRLERAVPLEVLQQFSRSKGRNAIPWALKSIAEIEEDANVHLTYDLVPNALLMLQHIISVRHLYDDFDVIKVMCHDKDHDAKGMEWLLGTVKQAMLRNQISIKDSTTGNFESVGLMYIDAKETSGLGP